MYSPFDVLEENYGYKKPNFSSLLPFLVYRWVVAFIKSLPDKIKEMRKMYEEYKERKRAEKEESEKPQEVIQGKTEMGLFGENSNRF